MGPTDQADPAPRLQAALRQHQEGRLPAAAALYLEVLRDHPDHPEALNLLGTLRAQQGSLAEARTLIEQALRQAPDRSAYHANLGQVLAMAGDEAAAIGRYREALGHDRANVGALLSLGNLYLRADRIEEAAQAFATALRINPRVAAAQEGMGCVHQRFGQGADAINCFERALALNPQSATAHANLAGLHLEQGRAQEAIRHFEAALRLSPERLDLHTNLGVALQREGRLEAAVAHYDQVLSRLGYSARALGAKGLALRELGRADEAATIFDHENLIHLESPPATIGNVPLAAFNRQLIAAIGGHPTLVADRAGKSTRGGSQSGELFDGTPGPFDTLAKHLQAALGRYFGDQGRASHPYRPAGPAEIRLTGWATVLRSGGYQEPHNHPSGLISGVYYVRVAKAEAADAGAIEFGRASDRFQTTAAPNLRLIRPEPGLLVLFPSHLWHRTLPFESRQDRISIAFDLAPPGR